MNYDADGVEEKLQDPAGNTVESFTGQQVENAASATEEPTPELTPEPTPEVSVPGQPTGLEVTAEQGSLDVSVDWDDVDGADSYVVRWRGLGPGNPLNEGLSVQTSETPITLADYGDWVVWVEACNDAGCGQGASKRFKVEPAHQTGLEPARGAAIGIVSSCPDSYGLRDVARPA